MTDLRRAQSRALKAAARLDASDNHHFPDKRVLITGSPATLLSPNGMDMLVGSISLVLRFTNHVVVDVDQRHTELVRNAIDRLAFGQSISYGLNGADPDRFDAVLSVAEVNEHPNGTAISANGWTASVTSQLAESLGGNEGGRNPMAALAAASLGAAEVFKRLIGLRPSRGALAARTDFSLLDYTCQHRLGPELPGSIALNALLAGGGAIGNGIVWVLQRLPVQGRLAIIDRQTFDDENLGTSILLGPAEVGLPKATALANQLASRSFEAFGVHAELSSYRRDVGSKYPHPDVALGALDNVDARHELQDFWPPLIIDGAIGDFACQVGRHPWGEDVACLRCLFLHTPSNSMLVSSRVTGLTAARVADQLTVVTDEDVVAAPLEKRDWLAARVGRQVCSVIEEAVASGISSHDQPDGFEPSVPFVATMSAAMVVAELVKESMGRRPGLDTRFQFDLLRGPGGGLELPRSRRSDCVCTTRAANINHVLARRIREP